MSDGVCFQIVYTPDEGGYNALEPVSGTTSWGQTLDQAREMITEALELYFAEVADDADARHASTPQPMP
ncbi:type II toxin-antitoxin system HicB family antitoxin [Streptomyces gamaensis]|uniref:Type II toxin-antitoxin system HicB family antitoxin n=1 Tax=Streptomyces gamaensis TaxID=1763542 RepID=A0ABW0Z9I0_9ACTN